MANEPIKRLRYFTGQFLEATDFETEQRYHSDMRHRGNRMLYDSAGIIDGLKVTPVNDGLNLNPVTKIKISPGIAVDGQGRELVLVESITVNLPAALRHSLTYFVTLTYDQQETDEQTPHDHDISDATRYQEWPKVEFFKDQPDLAIVLAKVTVDGTGNLSGAIDASMRQYANGRFPGNLTVGAGGVGGIKASHIDGINHSSEEKGDLLLNWNTETNVLIGCKEKKSSLLVSGNLGVGTNTLENKEDSGRVVDVVGTDSSRLSVRTTTDKIDARVQVQARDPELWGSKPGLVIGTKTNHALSLGTAGQTRLTIDTAGKVGIGRTDPQATLHVNGSAILAGNLELTDSNPALTQGFKNVLTPKNLIKAWGVVETVPGAGEIGARFLDGFNVKSVKADNCGMAIITLEVAPTGDKCISGSVINNIWPAMIRFEDSSNGTISVYASYFKTNNNGDLVCLPMPFTSHTCRFSFIVLGTQ